MKQIGYVCGPFTGSSPEVQDANCQAAIDFARAWGAATHEEDLLIVPHTLSVGRTDTGTYTDWMVLTSKAQMACDFVALMPNWANSRGACAEVLRAQRVGQPIARSPQPYRADRYIVAPPLPVYEILNARDDGGKMLAEVCEIVDTLDRVLPWRRL